MVKAMKTCSIREVARRVGVAPSTVSRVLANHGGIQRVTAGTREKIIATARQLNYTPNVNALRLFNKRVGVIGLVAPSFRRNSTHIFDDPHLTRIISGLEEPLNERQYHLLLLFSDDAFIARKRYLSLFRERNIDGLLIWGAQENEMFWGELAEAGWPHLFLTGLPVGMGKANYLASDYEQAGYVTIQHLLAKGHRQLAWIGGNPALTPNRLLEAGFARALGEYGMSMNSTMPACHSKYKKAEGAAAVESWLAQGIPFTAVACACHNLAAGALASLRGGRHRIKIPGQVAVACCDCPESAQGDIADLTRVEARDFEIGQRAATSIFTLIEKPETPIRIRVGVEFHPGKTT
jgi:DNA-binding LacI/PurR family transcriptional regulator